MKIQCNACEAAEARVLCCADEAALCGECDRKVHAANKLAGKHQRVPLSASPSQMPKCDICQEAIGYFFCVEDRALLCRRCDVVVHTANSLVFTHRRFLLTGVKVGLEPTEPGPSSERGMSLPRSNEKNAGTDPPPVLRRTNMQVTTNDQSDKPSPGVDISSSKSPAIGGSTAESISLWQLDEFLDLSDYNDGPSKTDCGRFGDAECSPTMRVADMEIDGDECMGQSSPDAFWEVPEIPSPPTASGLNWPNNPRTPSDYAAFVPDVVASPTPFYHRRSHGESFKRRRHI